MKKLICTLSAFAALTLSGCVTKSNPAHTEVYIPGAGVVDYHCPPGQRKKGRC